MILVQNQNLIFLLPFFLGWFLGSFLHLLLIFVFHLFTFIAFIATHDISYRLQRNKPPRTRRTGRDDAHVRTGRFRTTVATARTGAVATRKEV